MKNLSITIPTVKGPRHIGFGHPAFIVAEVSANHGQDLNRAENIVRAAAAAGADAIKLQTYLPSTMTIDCDNEYFQVKGSTTPEGWKNQTLFNLYEKAYTPWDWHPRLQALTEQLGMVFFSTPFDASAVDFLEKMKVPLYKVASYELTDIPLLQRIAKTKKPVIISTGFGSLSEITQAVETLRSSGAEEIAILHCVTSYSKNADDNLQNTNLSTMADLAERFQVVVGFSDNTGGIEVPLQAAIMGASIIEKHVVGDNIDGALDANFSLAPSEFKTFVASVRKSELIRGLPSYGSQNENEKYFQNFRRSLFAVKDIRKGEKFSNENMRVIRPAFGLEPLHYTSVLGKSAATDIQRGTPLKWDLVQS